MTSSQILTGWGIYLAGALACTMALWMITGSVKPRLRRLLRAGTLALLVTPWWHSTDVNVLLPALWVMVFDGLSSGFPEMARAGLPLVFMTAVSAIVATSLPVREKSGKKGKKQSPSSRATQKPNNQKQDRQEPTL